MAQPTIKEGSTGPAVSWAQYLMVREFLSYTDVDGIFGPKTKSAIEIVQRGSHLTVDGIVGPATWPALESGKTQPPMLKSGSTGIVVQRLQIGLNEGRGDFAPSSNPVLTVDGLFGPQTELAVKGMQSANGIPADGVVWCQTYAVPIHAAGMVFAGLCHVTGPWGGP